MSQDKALFMLLLGDLCDAFNNQWHTLDIVKLPELLMQRHTLTCIFLPSFASEYRSIVDDHLQHCSYYLGAVVPDLSNPLQQQLLVDFLFRDAFIEKGVVHMELNLEGDLDGDFDGADKFSKQGIVGLPIEEFAKRSPKIPIPRTLSRRAMVTLMRLQNRLVLNIHERLASQLSSLDTRRNSPIEYDWDLEQLPNAPDEVEVKARKVTDYLLNPLHEKGKSKAKFFEKALGIVAADWRFLHAQLADSLRKASFENIRFDDHGISFDAHLAIQGRDGRTATVKTGWIIRPKERASLVTAYPGARAASQASAQSPAVVSPEVQGTDRWEAIFELAKQHGELAAEECVPTPMKISGGELIMDGKCGGAYVVVPDARRGFARWLRTSGHGVRHHRNGMYFYAKTHSQSADQATAYAEAFAKVLRINGIGCKVERYLT